jgi:hypothetical protein
MDGSTGGHEPGGTFPRAQGRTLKRAQGPAGKPAPAGTGARKPRTLMLTDAVWKQLGHLAIETGRDRSDLASEFLADRLKRFDACKTGGGCQPVTASAAEGTQAGGADAA